MASSSSSSSSSSSAASDIVLKVKTLDHKQFQISLLSSASVPQLKEKVESATGVTESRQRLIFRGKVLQNDKNISAYALEDGHTLHLVVRPENPDVGETPDSQPTTNSTSTARNATSQPSASTVASSTAASNFLSGLSGADGPRVVMGATITVPEGSDIDMPILNSIISNIVSSVQGAMSASSMGSNAGNSRVASSRLSQMLSRQQDRRITERMRAFDTRRISSLIQRFNTTAELLSSTPNRRRAMSEGSPQSGSELTLRELREVISMLNRVLSSDTAIGPESPSSMSLLELVADICSLTALRWRRMARRSTNANSPEPNLPGRSESSTPSTPHTSTSGTTIASITRSSSTPGTSRVLNRNPASPNLLNRSVASGISLTPLFDSPILEASILRASSTTSSAPTSVPSSAPNSTTSTSSTPSTSSRASSVVNLLNAVSGSRESSRNPTPNPTSGVFINPREPRSRDQVNSSSSSTGQRALPSSASISLPVLSFINPFRASRTGAPVRPTPVAARDFDLTEMRRIALSCIPLSLLSNLSSSERVEFKRIWRNLRADTSRSRGRIPPMSTSNVQDWSRALVQAIREDLLRHPLPESIQQMLQDVTGMVNELCDKLHTELPDFMHQWTIAASESADGNSSMKNRVIQLMQQIVDIIRGHLQPEHASASGFLREVMSHNGMDNMLASYISSKIVELCPVRVLGTETATSTSGTVESSSSSSSQPRNRRRMREESEDSSQNKRSRGMP